MNSIEIRASMTGGLWMMSGLILIALFIGAGLQGELTAWHIGFAITILSLAVIATPFMLRFKLEEGETEREKAKRERIDAMLRDMSDEELLELKQRLADGEFSDAKMLDYLSDDGELILRS